MSKKFAPVHPGEILLEDFLKPLGISQYRLAHDGHWRRCRQVPGPYLLKKSRLSWD
jgi:hypothetical protein